MRIVSWRLAAWMPLVVDFVALELKQELFEKWRPGVEEG